MTGIRWITILILLLTLSGLLLAVIPPLAAWYAVLLITLIHLLLAAVLVILAGPLLFQHIQRSNRWRSGGVSSIFSLALLVMVILTGASLLIQGQRGRLALAHTVSAALFLCALIVHSRSRLGHLKRRRGRTLRIAVTSIFVALVFGAMATSRSSHSTVSPESKQFAPATFRILGELPDYDEYEMAAKRCAECHKEIADQWKESMHAMADTELFYARVVGEFRKEFGFQASNWCAGCHSPLRLGRGELNEKVATVAQPNVDCIVCHSIRGAHDSIGNNGYDLMIARQSGYELAGTQGLSDRLLLIQPEAHRSRWNSSFMRTPEFCGSCHRQVLPDFLSGGNGELVLQDTYTEWARSKYNTTDKATRRTCQDCHMPRKPGLDVDLGNKRPSHLFLGGSYDIARISGSHTAYAESKRFLQQAATIAITTVRTVKDGVELIVKVTNSGAGHNLPTGVTDLRQMWVAVTVTNDAGEIVYESGKIDAAGFLDSSAAVFGMTLGDANGNPVHFHHIAKARQVLSDTTIPAGETREVKYAVPTRHSRRLQVDAKLMHRAVPQNFINHYMTPDLRSEVVVMAQVTTTINLDSAR